MSGAEVALVLGIISSVIAIIDGSQKWYDAAKDAKGLHEAFRKVAENVPLVLDTLRAAEKAQKQVQDTWQNFDDTQKEGFEKSAEAIKPVFQTCKVNAKALRDIFEEVMPGDEAGRLKRYTMALKAIFPDKQRKVENLMKEILEKLQLLHTHHYFNTAVDVSRIGAGIEELRTVESSDPDESNAKHVNSGSGPQNIQSGSGKQFNNTISGGTGNSQHIADSQNFHYGAK
jgi:hypothetical protein